MPSPKPPLPAPLGVPLSWLYRAAIGHINRRFDRGRGVVTFDRPVISVGNLSVGGTGKTPMVRQIVRWLLDAGHRPCIAMRGYAAGDGLSDEAQLYSAAFPTVPIVAQANRTLGLIRLFASEHESDGEHSDCIVLDDGFQHRQIARTLDIVLIDATRSPFADRLLPAGFLREPVESLRRAGAVVMTHAEAVSEADLSSLIAQVEKVRGERGGVDAVCGHEWSGLAVGTEGIENIRPTASLAGKRVLAVCAIGNPGPFLRTVERASGTPLVDSIVLRDHDPYREETVDRIVTTAKRIGAGVIVVTEKDWVKLRHVAAERWPCEVVRPRLEVTFDRGVEILRALVLEAAITTEEPTGALEDQGNGTAKV
ncbi:MAG: tetraacyldisaccharide 4'-kinase [Phycisphaeraceae bacterium]|nr:tetraacyldisaccharide 4'-kinase [Phycisphaeraceae bacterium]